MKKFLPIIAKQSTLALALIVLIVGPFQPLIAQAQNESDGLNTQATAQQTANNTASNESAGINTSKTPSQIASTPSPTSAGTNTTPKSNCAITSGGSIFSGGDWAQCITDIVYVFTVGIGTGFAYTAAYFFNWAVSLSLNGSAYALNFVSQGWATARDLANMTFLFILLYIAFKIMFSAETGDTIHMLTMVIVVALLVNFSFFFTRLAIDAGNILAIQFYNAIPAQPVSATAAQTGVVGGITSGLNSVAGATTGANIAGQTKDLTASIMNMLNLQGLLGNSSFQAYKDSANYSFLTALISLSFLYIAAAIMLWGLTVAFMTSGVKFIVRIVVLWFLIIASPLAFVAKAVPSLNKYYDRWQSELIAHVFYPVVFMFIFLILTNFSVQMSGQNGLISGVFQGLSQQSGSAGFVATIAVTIANVGIRLGFVLAMLYIGMRAANQLSIMGADAAQSGVNWAGGRLSGGVGWTGRNTVGWGAYKFAQSTPIRNLEARSGALGLFGRGMRATTGAIGRASFDVRGTPGLSNVLPKNAGKAQKGGYETSLKESADNKEKKLKSVEPSEGQKEQARQAAEQETGYAVHSARLNEAKGKRDAANARLQALIEKGAEDSSEAKDLKEEVNKHQNTMSAASGRMKILDDITQNRAKELSGEGASKTYANTLTTRNVRNLWIPFRSSKEAAAKVRKGKSPAEKVLKAFQEANKEVEEAEKKEGGGKEGEKTDSPKTDGGDKDKGGDAHDHH